MIVPTMWQAVHCGYGCTNGRRGAMVSSSDSLSVVGLSEESTHWLTLFP